jgi:PAS domain S-box-containing protein
MKPVSERINLLLIDDDEDYYILIRDTLSEVSTPKFKVHWAGDYRTGLDAILGNSFDICLLDYQLDGRTGLELMEEAVKAGCRTPFVLLTGLEDFSVDLQAMKTGAVDYLVKDHINAPLLERSIRYAIDRRQKEEELRKYQLHLEELVRERAEELIRAKDEAEHRAKEAEEGRRILDALMEYVPVGIAIVDAPDGRIRLVSKYWQQTLGRSEDYLKADPVGRHGTRGGVYHSDGICPASREDLPFCRTLRTGETITGEEWVLKDSQGRNITAVFNAGPIRDLNGSVIGAVIVWIDISERKQMEEKLRKAHDELEIRIRERTEQLVRFIEELRESERQLRLLSSRRLDAQEEERKRIAHELHDSIGASLGAIRFSVVNALNTMEQGTATTESIKSLKEIVSLVEHTIEEARRIYMNLRPSMIEHLGIIPTIGWFVRQFEPAYPGIRIETRVGVEEEQIPEPLKIVIYRIMQEAFHNTAKYGNAETINLSLQEKGGHIELIVRDNGVGFDVSAAYEIVNSKGGLGLTSMRERVQSSGGVFSIESTIGAGTMIKAMWNVDKLA